MEKFILRQVRWEWSPSLTNHVTSVKQVVTKLIDNPNESLRINHDHAQQKRLEHLLDAEDF